MTMYLIAQGVGAGVKALGGLTQKDYGDTAVGRRMQFMSEHGAMTPGQEANLINRSGATAGELSQRNLSDVQGMQIASGMGPDSIATQKGYMDAQSDVNRTLTDYAKDIYQSEEDVKHKAKGALAEGSDADAKRKRDTKMQLLNDLVGMGTSYLGSKADGSADMKAQYLKMAQEGYDPQKVMYQGKKIGYGPGGQPTMAEQEKIKATVTEYIQGMDDKERAKILPLLQQIYPWLFQE
jgi:hypothetical protein